MHELRRHAIPDASLLYLLILIMLDEVVRGHDIDILVTISALPKVVAGRTGDPTLLHFDEFIRYEGIRGRKGPTVGTDSV